MTASIKVESLTIKIPYFLQAQEISGGWFATLVRAASAVPKREFATLLQDVSFEAVEGDRIALLGRNGAGKTTLLRTLTGAFPPSAGRVRVEGTRQALLNMSIGFNQEATLTENILLRATAMGLPALTVKELVLPILEFAELTELAGRRLLTLSSGQRMRLGFAIATAVQTEIMLLDEWFGTGDTHFVKKARERLTDHVAGSKIVVVASHNQSLTRRLCNKGLVLERGQLVYFGPLENAIKEYEKIHPPGSEPKAGDKKSRDPKGSDRKLDGKTIDKKPGKEKVVDKKVSEKKLADQAAGDTAIGGQRTIDQKAQSKQVLPIPDVPPRKTKKVKAAP
jgi:lipopolysaccharide transport system ATP-binding protein